jgi:hypothetical protein
MDEIKNHSNVLSVTIMRDKDGKTDIMSWHNDGTVSELSCDDVMLLVAERDAAIARAEKTEGKIEELVNELKNANSKIALMLSRINGDNSENCLFCMEYPASGHSQQVPMCGLCQVESDMGMLKALAEKSEELYMEILNREHSVCSERDRLRELLKEIMDGCGDWYYPDGKTRTWVSELSTYLRGGCGTVLLIDPEIKKEIESVLARNK